MKLSYNHIIQLHIEMDSSLTKLCKEINLHEFGRYLDEAKGEGWHLSEITERDLRGYFTYLTTVERDTKNLLRRMEMLIEFMDFALEYGFLEKNTWKGISSEDKP